MFFSAWFAFQLRPHWLLPTAQETWHGISVIIEQWFGVFAVDLPLAIFDDYVLFPSSDSDVLYANSTAVDVRLTCQIVRQEGETAPRRGKFEVTLNSRFSLYAILTPPFSKEYQASPSDRAVAAAAVADVEMLRLPSDVRERLAQLELELSEGCS
ncbi:unnamed protein product [Toxocara canis]|uniref:RNase H domain-containing protein n=1 Tax=Toxocara canis TaxID=6265 RepID=A0A183UIT8_TOXCA|nr:unnamed protein product [Toxocara canis]